MTDIQDAFRAAADQAAAESRARQETRRHGHDTTTNGATFAAYLEQMLTEQDQATSTDRPQR